jgi:hydrogenase maturation protease
VVGIGNPYRRDDGVGPAVAVRIAELGIPGVRVVRLSDADPADLLDEWAGVEHAVLVDAALGDPPVPGRVRRVAVHELGIGDGGLSTHGLGVGDAVRLGAILGRLPSRLAVLTVDAADVGPGLGLSALVAGAVPVLVGAVLDELARPGDSPRSG